MKRGFSGKVPEDIELKEHGLNVENVLMQPLLTVDIEKISVVERLQLIEELWDSILANPESLPVTDEQKQILDERLEQHHQSPEEGASWEVVKARLSNL